jgi:hypothetical protein
MPEQERLDTHLEHKENHNHTLEHGAETASPEPASSWEGYSLKTLSIFFENC